MTFGERVRELRKAKGLTLRDVASKVGINFTYLSKIENSKLDFSDYPSEKLIHKLAKALGGDTDELLLLAEKVPDRIRRRVIDRPDAFSKLARLDDMALDRLVARSSDAEGAVPLKQRKNMSIDEVTGPPGDDHTSDQLMLLYHGTTGRVAEKAKIEGLKPRLNDNCNWPDMPGRIDCVYLTTVFGPLYAMCAHQKTGGHFTSEEAAVIEIGSLDEALLLPDEDFLFQCVTMYYPDPGPTERDKLKKMFVEDVLPRIRDNLELYAGLDWFERLSQQFQAKVCSWAKQLAGTVGWKASIAGLGTCAFKGTIRPESVKRIAYFSKPHSIFTHYAGLNPTIEIHCGSQDIYSTCNRWIFGDCFHGPNNEVYAHREGLRVWCK